MRQKPNCLPVRNWRAAGRSSRNGQVENLTLNITEEIHVRTALDATFEALLEQIRTAHRRNVVRCGAVLYPRLEWYERYVI